MSGQFKVGEVLVGQNFVLVLRRNGQECEVIEAGRIRTGICSVTHVKETSFKYLVRWSDGDVASVKPHHLRRKQPPAGEQSILDMFKLPAPKRERETA